MGCLYIAETVHDFRHRSPYINRRTEYFARCRVNPAGTLCTPSVCWDITDTAVLEIILVESWIFSRIVAHSNHLFQTDTLKCIIPVQYAFLDRLFPRLRESVVDVKNNLFLGHDYFASFPCVIIRWFYSPALHIFDILDIVTFVKIHQFLVSCKEPNPRIGQTRAHLLFWKQ